MKWVSRTTESVAAAMVVTGNLALITVIWLAVSAGSAEGRRIGYFGAVFVDVHKTPVGATRLGIGFADPAPIALSVVATTMLFIAVAMLRDRRRSRPTQHDDLGRCTSR